MKKFFVVLCMALVPLATFTSCSDDDDESLAAKASGTYATELSVSLGGIPHVSMGENVKTLISKKGDNAINISITNFIIPGMEEALPITVENVPISGTMDNIMIPLFTGTIQVPVSANLSVPAQLDLKGDILDQKDLELEVNIVLPGMGMGGGNLNVNVMATGTK